MGDVEDIKCKQGFTWVHFNAIYLDSWVNEKGVFKKLNVTKA